MTIVAVSTDQAPKPNGTYSQAVGCENLVFVSGQTPRDLEGNRLSHLAFGAQARQALDNLQAIANASGLSLHNCVKVTVYLRDPANAREFDVIYSEYVNEPWPSRTLVQSSFVDFEIEVDAILMR
jgi:2-iminobutanoate/2-iminopropanoate deaminase